MFLFVMPRGISVQNLRKIGQETKKLQKIGNDIIVMSFLKIVQQFFVCEYILLIPIDVPSFQFIEGQIKQLQGVVPNIPQAENDQKSPGWIGLKEKQRWGGTMCPPAYIVPKDPSLNKVKYPLKIISDPKTSLQKEKIHILVSNTCHSICLSVIG